MADKKEVVTFPEQQEYLDRINAAKGGAPVGGVPMPQMPRFDQVGGDRYQGVQQPRPTPNLSAIIPPDQRAELERQGKIIPGVGSAYMANQPALQQQPQPQAAPGQPQAWQNPPRSDGGLRPETVAGIEAVAKANTAEPKKEATAEELKEEVDKVTDEFDYDEFGNKIHTLLQNKARREAIELRCPSMNFDDLIVHQEVRQKVPIIPGKLEPTFRSAGGHEELYIKKKMSGERGSEGYLANRFALLGLTLGLYSINGQLFPSHLDKDGEVNDDAFNAKYKTVIRFPFDLLADLSINYGWFGKRVQKLLVVDQIKGF